MPRLSRGTVVEITDAHFKADQDLRALQQYAISHPSSSIASDPMMAQMEKQRNRSWRAAIGSALTGVTCRCGALNPHITGDMVTECCASRTFEVAF